MIHGTHILKSNPDALFGRTGESEFDPVPYQP